MTTQVIDLPRPRVMIERSSGQFRAGTPEGETQMNAPQSVVDRYIAMWNATDPEDRRDLVAGAWTEEARYLDPLMEGKGHEGIDAMVEAVQQRFPDHRFARTSEVDAHNDRVRFTWELAAAGQPPLASGVDFGVVSPDGRLESITGFLDQTHA
jgi:hypothetical protein